MKIFSWGMYPVIEGQKKSFVTFEHLQSIYKKPTVIPYGNGRSYGDSAINKTVVTVRDHARFLDFDAQNGILHLQAGVLLSEVIEVFLPRGWFLSVTPGTKLITVGGAIASDVHGKNHHIMGCFSDIVKEFLIALPGEKTATLCSHETNSELFKATCGGMGLTGVILEAKIQLQKVSSSSIDQVTLKSKNLAQTFEFFERYKDYTYSVAWIDCLAKGKYLGRSLLMVGEHAKEGSLEVAKKKHLNVPFNFPSFTLNKLTVKAFNMLYYGRIRKEKSEAKVSLDAFFYPLDAINNWNRIYGKSGFTQYQFVLPKEESFEGLTKILERISKSGMGSFLAVLKLFGKGNENYLSFPKEGYTLALDFKIEKRLFPLLDELDEIVNAYGGRVYLTKDVRISKAAFEKGYEQIDLFRRYRKEHQLDRYLESLQSKRLGL